MAAIFKKAVTMMGLTVMISGFALIGIPVQESLACGWGNSGGQAFGTPGIQNNGISQSAVISKDQAVQLVTQHVKKLNPSLKIGNVNDVGSLYEAEILSSANEEVLQIIGVNKQSGKLVIIN